MKVSEFLDQQLSSEVATLEKSLAPKAVSRAKGNWNHLRSALQAQSMLSHHRGAPKKQAADSLFGSWKTSTHDKALSLATRRGVEAARRRIAELDKPPRMHFLERITQALCDHLPVLWKLGHSFQPVVLEDEAGRRTSRLFEDFSLEDHVGDGTVSRAKEMEVSQGSGVGREDVGSGGCVFAARWQPAACSESMFAAVFWTRLRH